MEVPADHTLEGIFRRLIGQMACENPTWGEERRCSSLPICLHDHASIFSVSLDSALSDFGVRILGTPIQAPTTPEPILPSVATGNSRHQLPTGCSLTSKPVLGGLHHDYRLEREVA
jgi:hypothetical protein